MKKILSALTLLVCSTGVFAQYIQSQGGVVSQGTLVNEKKEAVATRKGFDGWVGVGGGIGGYVVVGVKGANFMATHIDGNFGYNISPRAFVGVGYKSLYANTIMGSWYANLRLFTSPKARTSFINLYVGMVHTGTIAELNCIEDGETHQDDYSYFNPQGLTGGFSAGYLWNHFALECGLGIFGGLEYEAGKKIINPYDLDWADEDRVESCPGLELFFRLSWRF